ncbi:MAG TPA: serine/threonine-protein kinase, partial [Polyangiaceae bacterium]|nr:serine/threonine-protein kinase [Polyangiaceae bacterium]
MGVFAGLWVFLPFLGALALTAALGIGALAVRRVSKRLSTPPFPTIAPEERLSAPPVPRVSVPPAPRVGIPSSAPRVSIPSSAPRVSFPSSAPRVSVSSAAPRINIPSAAPRVGPERDLAELEVRADGGPRPGDVLGQYQLLACVGEGGMGRVWAARNISSVLQRIVAVKTATRRAEQKTELRHLFMDEARIALLVRHPNVCGVNEFGEHEGVLYQVMEWCDGASLRQVLDRLPGGSMDIPVAVRIMAKVSAGLHAAHELLDDDGVPMHVVHRDVSPQNILISTTGQVKVTDFGVAKANGQLHRPLGSSEVKGKVSYIAPEQVMGGEVDRRADIFALGSILYEATTGHCPFSSEGSPSTLYQLISQP